MHDRSRQLANQATRQVGEFVRVLTDLAPREWGAPCHGEKNGDTVCVLARRVTAVYDRMTTIVEAVDARESAGRGAHPPRRLRLARPGQGQAATATEPAALIAGLKERGLALAARLSRLSQAQLSRPLPMTVEGLDHMDKPLGMIVEYLLYCQADRLETIRGAVAAARGEPYSRQQEETGAGPSQFCRDPEGGIRTVPAVAAKTVDGEVP